MDTPAAEELAQSLALLAAAAASTLHPDFTRVAAVREWKAATGQN